MKCKYCNQEIQDMDTTVFTTNGDLCCEDCAEKYVMCAGCGRIIIGHSNIDINTQEIFCDDCF